LPAQLGGPTNDRRHLDRRRGRLISAPGEANASDRRTAMGGDHETGGTVSTNFQERSAAWSGWVIFAGIVMFTIGCVNLIQGFVALFKNDVYLVSKSGLIATTSFSYWGWALLLWGALMIIVALGLFSGNEAARWFAIAAVVVNIIIQFSWFPAYPLWSLVVIGLDFAVLYALTAAWTDVKEDLST